MPPVANDAECWQWLELPEMPVVRHVFPGTGGRPRATVQPTMASLADEVAAGYEGPLDLVGVSLGGVVAQHLALRHPDRVRSLLVACTGASADRETMERRAADSEALGMAGMLDDTLERWFTPEFLASEEAPPALAYARSVLLALDPACFADQWRAIAGHDATARLGEIAVPTTALAGTADRASPPERTRVISDGVQRGRLVVLEGPHMMHLERPRELSAAIADHLRWAGALE